MLGKNRPPHDHDGRIDTPVVHRNHHIIADALIRILGDEAGGANRDRQILEIGSGSGQHICGFARAMPHFTWWPTDINPSRVASIAAWRQHEGLDNLCPPAQLDASETPWAPKPDQVPLGQGLRAVICINVVHISPWETTLGLIAGAGQYLSDGGQMVLYGPYRRDGAHTAPSNADFDGRLKAENPAWGVRDIAELETSASNHGLTLGQIIPVPANNFILVFDRPGTGTPANA
jgi:hypothetical protein